jgi:hypothetical protein
MPKARPQTQNDPAISDPKEPYHVRLFINDRQCGDNQTFIDWYVDDEDAITDARAHFTSQGYQVDEVSASYGQVRPSNRFVPALNGRILTVRLTNPPAPQP